MYRFSCIPAPPNAPARARRLSRPPPARARNANPAAAAQLRLQKFSLRPSSPHTPARARRLSLPRPRACASQIRPNPRNLACKSLPSASALRNAWQCPGVKALRPTAPAELPAVSKSAGPRPILFLIVVVHSLSPPNAPARARRLSLPPPARAGTANPPEPAQPRLQEFSLRLFSAPSIAGPRCKSSATRGPG